MPQVSTQEFERLPLRVHTFLAGVPLHDVWSVDLPRWRAGVTLDEFLQTAKQLQGWYMWLFEIVVAIHALTSRADAAQHPVLRWTVLRLGSRASAYRYLRNTFTDTDRSRSLVANRHARWLFPRRVPFRKRATPRVDQSDRSRCGAERPGRDSDRLPVLFRRSMSASVSRFTPFYMASIDPFRKLIVYPSLLRSVRARWNQAFRSG